MNQPSGGDRNGKAPGSSDTISDLWDRIADDLAERGCVCAETVEKLIDEACHRPAGTADEQDQTD